MAQILRVLRRRFGIAAPRVAIRTHVAWYWRWLGYAALGAVVFAVGWTTYDYGMELAGYRQREASRTLARLTEQLRQRDAQLAELRAQLAAAEGRLQIERATYGDLAKQVKSLTEQNAAIREDLAFFQTLMAGGGRQSGVSINRLQVQPELLPGEYRYRLLLVQSGQRVKEFQGKLQLLLHLEQGDSRFVMTLPAEGARDAGDYKVSFKFFKRIEGTFKVAPGAVVRTLQVRIFEDGSATPTLTQSVNIS